ncbi:MAG: lysylphosphatidylglycerol synthase transmembrane domain-containing protein [Gammaproteobacteria bacterium]|nr:lysylphosphatidylglycerol synthase transmembrane domain-containing protein [Gammaproteobacteria bacterium]
MKKKNVFNLIVWAAAGSLVFLTLRELPIAEMGLKLAEISTSAWFILFIINVAILFLTAARWKVLANIFNAELSLVDLFKIRQAGSTISFVTPGPQFGGEPLQVYWMHQKYDVPIDIALTTLGSDRLLETIINLLILVIGLSLIIGSGLDGDFSKALLVTSITLAILIMLTVLILKKPRWLAKIFGVLFSRFSKKISYLENYHQMSKAIDRLVTQIKKNQSRVFFASVLGVAGWFLLTLELYFMMKVLGLSPSLYDIIFVMVGIRLALLMPIPGGVGTVEASLLWSFSILNLAAAGAAGLIALSRLRDAIILIVGMVSLSDLSKDNPGVTSSDDYHG